ncbi:MAG: T9SS type A sorting domain-containing protein [Sphingobacteriaceae bacterium]|nr:T9SS type A sorting domain-containing protein [Cytophagaceae bacterium]
MKNQYSVRLHFTEANLFLVRFKVLLDTLKKRRNGLSFGLMFLVSTLPSFSQNQTVQQGGTATFSVGSYRSYRWYFSSGSGGYHIPGETDRELTITNVQPVNQGFYYCLVTYRCGFLSTCDDFIYSGYLTVTPSIEITQQPESQAVVCQGSVASTTVSATGATAYQWYKNNPNTTDEVIGQNTATLSLSDLQPADGGNYYCRVSDGGNVVWSNAFALTVNEVATASPITAGATAICQNGTTTFSATWGGSATFGGFTDGGVNGTFTTLSQVGNGISVSYKPPLNYSGTMTISFVTTDPPGPCSYVTTTTSLTVNPLPTAVITGLAASYCQNASAVTLSGMGTPGGGSFAYTVNGNPATQLMPSTLSIGPPTHTVGLTYTDENGCKISTSQEVSIIQPVVTQEASVSGGPVCAGQTVSLTFDVNCPVNMSFEAFLSTSTGDFPGVSLGAVQPGATNTVRIPSETVPSGSGYIIQVVGSNPTLMTTSNAFTVRELRLNQPVVAENTVVCANKFLTFSFSTGDDCTFPEGNEFRAELSNSAGTFVDPVVSLGVVTPGSNQVRIPYLTVPTSANYRIRVVSTTPARKSMASIPFKITALGFSSVPTVNLTAVCVGGVARVTFTTNGNCEFPSGNGFNVQLSGPTGSFTPSFTDLGSVTPGINNVTIPENLPAGTGYRARIVSTIPSLTSGQSVAFQIKTPTFSSTPTVIASNACPGQTIRVSFSTSCIYFSGNTFTAELSNAAGIFGSSAVPLGSVTPGANAVLTLPSTTFPGTGYRVRIVSSQPVVTSAVSSAFQIKACTNREATPEETGLHVSVSPNPSPDGLLRVVVRGAEGQLLRIELFNGSGTSVRQQNLKRASVEDVLEWDIARQPAGLYLLRVSGAKEARTVKVLH